MAFIKNFKFDAPNDPEVSEKVRDFLEYYMVFPTGYNENEKYGVVFCISGYGTTANSEYYLNKLCPYISDKYNIISVGVRYHNDARVKSNYSVDIPSICKFYNVEQDYFFNMENKSLIDGLFDLLYERRIFSLEPRLALKSETYHKYSSFGFMPAIDHLFVLANILKNYNIDRRNIIAFGTSYGGYIASLMAKYAPQTFSLVIDNSGFCITQLKEVLGSHLGGMTGSIPRYKDGRRYEIPITTNTLWSIDETSELYFSDAHKNIRNLLFEDHRIKSNTMYCCYHSVKDSLVPIILKDRMYEILSKYNPTYYKRVGDKDIDGELFKSTEHGMNASLRKMFDYSIKRFKESELIENKFTDFDLGSTNSFICQDKRYIFTFSDRGLVVSIDKIKMDSYLSVVKSQSPVELNVIPNNSSTDKTSNRVQVIKQIIYLVPTMKEGLEYIQQNSNIGNVQIIGDFKYCLDSIENAIQTVNKNLPENQIELMLKELKKAIDILFMNYNTNQIENAKKVIHSQLIPSFQMWEEEIVRVLHPLLS